MPATHEPAAPAHIARGLLELLASPADGARRALALRALGCDESALAQPAAEVAPAALSAAFDAVELDDAGARRLGRALVAPERVGLLLRFGGVGTPERALRRSDLLLARERADAGYAIESLEPGHARIAYRAPDGVEADARFCRMREGMFEGVPELFGQPAAGVREIRCRALGGDDCCFEIHWARARRSGLWAGVAGGALFAAALLVALGGPASLPAWLAAGAVLVLAAVAGRSLDLAGDLRAQVGRARTERHLVDDTERALAEKMDALAKLDATVERATDEHAAGRGRTAAAGSGDAEELADRVRELRGAVADLQRDMSELDERVGAEDVPPRLAELFASCEERALVLRQVAAGLEREVGPPERRRTSQDLVAIVRRGVGVARRSLPEGVELACALGESLLPVVCDGFQIETLVEQLVRNAVEASGERGRVEVELREGETGIELSIVDHGTGIEPETVDEVFDPFFGSHTAGVDASFGLPVCARIVEEHGGELRIAAEVGRGTRATILLPRASD